VNICYSDEDDAVSLSEKTVSLYRAMKKHHNTSGTYRHSRDKKSQ